MGVILAIVLPLTLGGHHDDPTPDPDNPVQPDPYVYQEFNPYYVDPANPPVVSTFEANFQLKFNGSAFNYTAPRPHDMSDSLQSFLGFHSSPEE